jgi:hypothetical protein
LPSIRCPEARIQVLKTSLTGEARLVLACCWHRCVLLFHSATREVRHFLPDTRNTGPPSTLPSVGPTTYTHHEGNWPATIIGPSVRAALNDPPETFSVANTPASIVSPIASPDPARMALSSVAVAKTTTTSRNPSTISVNKATHGPLGPGAVAPKSSCAPRA